MPSGNSSALGNFVQRCRAQPPGVQVLLQIGLLFLPAIPAYIWIWPNASGWLLDLWQILAYLYVLAGTWFIGRRYPPAALGLNCQGWGVSLFWGGMVIVGRTLVILAVDWGSPSPPFIWWRGLWDAFYYFALVALTEELLFRGLLYRALLDWRGLRWAIWGTSLGFVLWHIFGQGPLVGAAMLLYGLFFALLRWRAGGISGLILIHGLIDWLGVQMLPSISVADLGRPDVPHPLWLLLGLALIVAAPLGLAVCLMRKITSHGSLPL